MANFEFPKMKGLAIRIDSMNFFKVSYHLEVLLERDISAPSEQLDYPCNSTIHTQAKTFLVHVIPERMFIISAIFSKC